MTDEEIRNSIINLLHRSTDKPLDGGKEEYKKWNMLEHKRVATSLRNASSSWFSKKSDVIPEDVDNPFLIQKIRAVPEAVVKTKKDLVGKFVKGPLVCNILVIGLEGSGKQSVISTLGSSHPYDLQHSHIHSQTQQIL